ncbi:hypothetical protein, partial [Streptomyces sp. NPDC001165]|uniref:hypothetical protein n=1 Tax=Streptomyces sp. NPDC001165 TaxID=3364546 RepID=UPI003677F919
MEGAIAAGVPKNPLHYASHGLSFAGLESAEPDATGLMLLLIVKPCGSDEPYCGRVRYLAESFILG